MMHQMECSECPATFLSTRADATTCSDRCRQRKSRRERGDDYVVTDADRELIKRLCADSGHPLATPPTPDEVRMWVAATARRT